MPATTERERQRAEEREKGVDTAAVNARLVLSLRVDAALPHSDEPPSAFADAQVDER